MNEHVQWTYIYIYTHWCEQTKIIIHYKKTGIYPTSHFFMANTQLGINLILIF